MAGPTTRKLTKTQQFRSSYSLRSSSSCRELSKHKSHRRFQTFRRLLRAVLLERLGMQSREFMLPMKPISKARPRSFQGQTRPYMPVQYKNWMKDAEAHLSEWWVGPPLERVASIELHFYGHARGDLDNLMGSVLDAMNGIVLKDDNVNVLPEAHARFTKVKGIDACVSIRITWGEQ